MQKKFLFEKYPRENFRRVKKTKILASDEYFYPTKIFPDEVFPDKERAGSNNRESTVCWFVSSPFSIFRSTILYILISKLLFKIKKPNSAKKNTSIELISRFPLGFCLYLAIFNSTIVIIKNPSLVNVLFQLYCQILLCYK